MALVAERVRVDLGHDAPGGHLGHCLGVNVAGRLPGAGEARHRILERVGVRHRSLETRGDAGLALTQDVRHLLPVAGESHVVQPEIEVHDVAGLDDRGLRGDGQEPSRGAAGRAAALHAQVGLEPRHEARGMRLRVEPSPDVADRGAPWRDDLVRQRAARQELRPLDQQCVVRPLVGQARVEQFFDQRLGRHDGLGGLRADRLHDELIGVVREAARDAAAAADSQCNRRGGVLGDQAGQRLALCRGLARRLEVPLDVLFRVPGEGHPREAPLAGVGEHEDVAPPDVRARRGDERGHRIVVELLVDDQPHPDLPRAHHAQQHLVASREPALADRDLAGHRQRRRRGGEGRGRRSRGRLGDKNRGPPQEHDGENGQEAGRELAALRTGHEDTSPRILHGLRMAQAQAADGRPS